MRPMTTASIRSGASTRSLASWSTSSHSSLSRARAAWQWGQVAWWRLGARPGRRRVEAPVGDDPVHPGGEGRVGPEPAEVAPGLDERVLGGVLGVAVVSEHAQGDPKGAQPVPTDELLERVEPS